VISNLLAEIVEQGSIRWGRHENVSSYSPRRHHLSSLCALCVRSLLLPSLTIRRHCRAGISRGYILRNFRDHFAGLLVLASGQSIRTQHRDTEDRSYRRVDLNTVSQAEGEKFR